MLRSSGTAFDPAVLFGPARASDTRRIKDDSLVGQPGLEAHRYILNQLAKTKISWIKENPDEAQRMIRDELRPPTRAEKSAELVARAWGRMTVTNDTAPQAFQHMLSGAQQAGFLRGAPDLSRLIEPP